MCLKKKSRFRVVRQSVACFLGQAKLSSGTLFGRYLRKDDSVVFPKAPGLVVGFELAVADVLDRLLVIVVSRQGEGDHQTLVAAEHLISAIVAILDTNLNRWVLIVD